MEVHLFGGLPQVQIFRFDDHILIGFLIGVNGKRSRDHITSEFDIGGACRADHRERYAQFLAYFEKCLIGDNSGCLSSRLDISATKEAPFGVLRLQDDSGVHSVTIRGVHPDLDAWRKDALLARVTWRMKPEFHRSGRTAYLHYKTSTYKLKGVGLYNPTNTPIYCGVRNVSEIGPQAPLEQEYEYRVQAKHVGFDHASGNPVIKPGESSPVGGIFARRARAEYENASLLWSKGVPSIRPVMWGDYDQLTLHGEQFGFVCSEVDDPYPYNLECIVEYPLYRYPEVDTYFSGVAAAMNLAGKSLSVARDRLAIAGQFYSQIGERLRDFSKCGLYRYSGGINNFFFSRASKKVVIWDLDSSCRLSEVTERFRWLEVLRDLCSCYHKIFIRGMPLLALGHYSLGDFRSAGLGQHLLTGYFSCDRNRIAQVDAVLWDLLSEDLECVVKGKRSMPESAMRCSRMAFYKSLMVALFDTYVGSPLGKLYPPHCTKAGFVTIAQDESPGWKRALESLRRFKFI